MTRFRFLTAGAWATLASALTLTSLPAAAQDEHRGGAWGSREARAERRAEHRAPAQTQSQAQPAARGGWAQQREARGDHGGGSWAQPGDRGAGVAGAHARAGATVTTDATRPDRGSSHAAPRDRSYGAYTRARDWTAQRQARDAASRPQHSGGAGAGAQDPSYWRRDRSYGAHSADPQRDRHADARYGRGGDAGSYAHGYRDNNRWGRDGRWEGPHWDSRAWRNDSRYDWFRHRAANRALFSLGRYYAPYRGYGYSRIGIGFRLGSPFYASRYWINDPWRYRLPDVYGPYRWVRYYDDALLVDIYSGEVVDVIHDFFW